MRMHRDRVYDRLLPATMPALFRCVGQLWVRGLELWPTALNLLYGPPGSPGLNYPLYVLFGPEIIAIRQPFWRAQLRVSVEISNQPFVTDTKA